VFLAGHRLKVGHRERSYYRERFDDSTRAELPKLVIRDAEIFPRGFRFKRDGVGQVSPHLLVFTVVKCVPVRSSIAIRVPPETGVMTVSARQ